MLVSSIHQQEMDHYHINYSSTNSSTVLHFTVLVCNSHIHCLLFCWISTTERGCDKTSHPFLVAVPSKTREKRGWLQAGIVLTTFGWRNPQYMQGSEEKVTMVKWMQSRNHRRNNGHKGYNGGGKPSACSCRSVSNQLPSGPKPYSKLRLFDGNCLCEAVPCRTPGRQSGGARQGCWATSGTRNRTRPTMKSRKKCNFVSACTIGADTLPPVPYNLPLALH